MLHALHVRHLLGDREAPGEDGSKDGGGDGNLAYHGSFSFESIVR
jgi:hypothetical protein